MSKATFISVLVLLSKTKPLIVKYILKLTMYYLFASHDMRVPMQSCHMVKDTRQPSLDDYRTVAVSFIQGTYMPILHRALEYRTHSMQKFQWKWNTH